MRIRELLTQLPKGGSPAGDAIWKEICELIVDKAKVGDAEVKRLVALEGVVPVELVLLFVRAFYEAARETVTDRGMLRALMARTAALLPPDEDGRPRRPPAGCD
jgi:hypothetical protein